MDKSFEQFLVDEIRHIRTGVDDLTTQVTDLQLQMTEYVPQAEIDALSKDIEVKFAECKSSNAGDVKSLTGWIIGAYLFIMTTAITLFTTLLSKK
jgi:hypothetical protein